MIFGIGSAQRLEETRRLVDLFQLGDPALKAELRELKEAVSEVRKLPILPSGNISKAMSLQITSVFLNEAVCTICSQLMAAPFVYGNPSLAV